MSVTSPPCCRASNRAIVSPSPFPSAFEVTPGSLKLFAFFADGPFDASAAEKRVTAAVAQARAAGKSPLQAEVHGSDGAAVASVLLQVEP